MPLRLSFTLAVFLCMCESVQARIYLAPASVPLGNGETVDVPVRLTRTSLDTNAAAIIRVQMQLPPGLSSVEPTWITTGLGISAPANSTTNCIRVGNTRVDCQVNMTPPSIVPIGSFTVAILTLTDSVGFEQPITALVTQLVDNASNFLPFAANTFNFGAFVGAQPELAYQPAGAVTAVHDVTGNRATGVILADLTTFPVANFQGAYSAVTDCRAPEAPTIFDFSQTIAVPLTQIGAAMTFRCTPQNQAVTVLMSCDEYHGGIATIRQWQATCPAGRDALFANGFE